MSEAVGRVLGTQDAMPLAIVLPVPLALVQTAAAIVPDQKQHLQIGEAARYLPVAREALQALAGRRVLVRVEDRDEQVVITKIGRSLHVQVKDHGEEVEVNGRDGERVKISILVGLALSRFVEFGPPPRREGEDE